MSKQIIPLAGGLHMWPFSSRKHKTLSQAVLSGEIHAVRMMLTQGADPNTCDSDDGNYPILLAVKHGPAMVQLLIDHGADANIVANGKTPLTVAEAMKDTEVAAILRKAAARACEADDEFTMGTRFRLQIVPRISALVLQARVQFPTDNPEQIADRVLPFVCQFPPSIPSARQEVVRGELRTLILRECGVPAKLRVRKQSGVGTQPAKPPEVRSREVTGRPSVPRTFDNLPSIAMAPVQERFSYPKLVNHLAEQASDVELVGLVQLGWYASPEESANNIDLLYDFSDDSKLVLMRVSDEHIIVRATFMRETSSQVTASSLIHLTEQLSQLAHEKGFHVSQVTPRETPVSAPTPAELIEQIQDSSQRLGESMQAYDKLQGFTTSAEAAYQAGDYQNALKHHLEEEVLARDLRNFECLGNCLNNQADLLSAHFSRHAEAQVLAREAQGIAARLEDQELYGQVANTLAQIKRRMSPSQPAGLNQAQCKLVMELWQTSGFRGVQWLPGDAAQQRWPTLAVLFDDRQSAEMLFGILRSKLGRVDHSDQLRIAVVEGPIPGKMPGYTFHVSAGSDGVSAVGRLSVTPDLQAFKEAMAKAKCFLLAPFAPDPQKAGDWDALSDYTIERSQIHFRKARDIGPGDPDEVVLK